MSEQIWVRKPCFVRAIQLTNETFDDIVVKYAGAENVQQSKIFAIRSIRFGHQRAILGDWIVIVSTGVKVYNEVEFKMLFDGCELTEIPTEPITVITASSLLDW